MPEPEILRRCAVCGAAVRSNATFCPQCGNATPRTSKSGAADPIKSHDTLRASRAPEQTNRNLPEAVVRPPAPKVPKATSVFIEEATYDPSIRFVVVAAVIFVVFLVLLVLSKFIT